MRVFSLFSGIGAFEKALENIGIDFELVGFSEIDKYAIQSYEAMYGKTRNYGDISKINKLDYADMWTYGFPCQDISVAGEQLGIIKGVTRSGLLYEVQRLLTTSKECNELPKFLIRKLTPLECWRLMGFTDEDFYKAKYYTEAEVSQLKLRSKKRYADLPLDEKIERVSNSQLYKQAGNSIAVPCLEHILTALLQPNTSLLNWLDDLLGGNK